MKAALFGLLATTLLLSSAQAEMARGNLETEDLPSYLHDRGTGLPLSMFGSYIQPRQFVVYPFFEYYRDHNAEYKPAELGFGLDEDFRGKSEAYEGILLLAYAFNDRVAIEMEAAIISAELEKSPDDPSALPSKLEESGLSDVEGQIRWRWTQENESHPEVFSYFETVFPTGEENSLIGTSAWELKLGVGAVRGFSWGTATARVAMEYLPEDGTADLGEYAIEYLKRLSPTWRAYAGFEGSQDELSWIGEAQWHFARKAYLKMNSAFGVTSKAVDWAPEVGVLFGF